MWRLLCSALLLCFELPVAVADGGVDDPVMAGYDLVAYHSLDPLDDGIPGSPDIRYRHDGYLYYFATQENLDIFVQDPGKYLPQYGGFCAWGVAWEYAEDGWPWDHNHMGPPCGPRDGWALLEVDGEKRLYCSIWRSYQDNFNDRREEGIRLANQRWEAWYGSLSGGPKNNGCYAWNWQDCFTKSIYDPENPTVVDEETPSPTPGKTETLFDAEEGALDTVWSEPLAALNGAVTWTWSLENITTVRPKLLFEITYTLDEEFVSLEDQYVAFGVAEQLMQGALVVCYPQILVNEEVDIFQQSDPIDHISRCKTFVGSGMGISTPNSDPVQPTVLLSELTSTVFRIRFSANLFACWSNPHWPARLLFSRGLLSGNGDPMPHINNGLHREAIPGVDLLSVVVQNATDADETSPSSPPPKKVLQPLPGSPILPVDGTAGTIEALQGRVTVDYRLFEYGVEREEVIQVKLMNVEFHEDSWYVGFGFAPATMSGLVITCTPRVSGSGGLTSTCHQWRGLGTNLYPLNLVTDAGGWFMGGVESNGTLINYTLLGRASDVLSEDVDAAQFRAILAIGRAAPDSGTPLMHTSQDRTSLFLSRLSIAVAAPLSSSGGDVLSTESARVSTRLGWLGSRPVTVMMGIALLCGI